MDGVMTDKPTYARANKLLDQTCRRYGVDPVEMRMAMIKTLNQAAGGEAIDVTPVEQVTPVNGRA